MCFFMTLISERLKKKPLFDGMCGSGTILIEAAMIANNIAPGLTQAFCSEDWLIFDSDAWDSARHNAQGQITNSDFRIYGSDNNPDILKTARYNIKRANISGIFVETKDLAKSKFKKVQN